MATLMSPFRFAGWGFDVPPTVMDNTPLTEHFGLEPDWIVEKTGIRERRVAAPGESTASLATNAARAALESAGLGVSDIDLIALATTTPEQPIPHTAAFVGAELGTACASFDLNTACSGFVYGMVSTAAMLNAGPSERVLLVGAETFSRVLNPDHRATAVIFGDGAGAVVMTRDPNADSGLLSCDLGCEGTLTDLVGIRAGGSRRPSTAEALAAHEHQLHMSGRAIFEFAVRTIVESSAGTRPPAALAPAAGHRVVPHPAPHPHNEAVGEKLNLGPDKTVLNVDRLGNTAAASIPIGLAEAASSGRLRHGDLVLLSSVGAGMTWGSALIRW